MGCSQIAQSFELIIISRLLVGICAGKELFLVAPRGLVRSGDLEAQRLTLTLQGHLSLLLVLVGGQRANLHSDASWRGSCLLLCFSKAGIEPRTL